MQLSCWPIFSGASTGNPFGTRETENALGHAGVALSECQRVLVCSPHDGLELAATRMECRALGGPGHARPGGVD